jgi:hypothetical protein
VGHAVASLDRSLDLRKGRWPGPVNDVADVWQEVAQEVARIAEAPRVAKASADWARPGRPALSRARVLGRTCG